MALKRQDLADALGVTTMQVSRLARRGMPTSSVREARAWRLANLDPSQAREFRVHTRRRVQPPKAAAPAPNADAAAVSIAADEMAIGLVERLAELADRDPTGPWTDDFRRALRELPLPLRAHLRLPLALVDRLVGPALEVLDIAPDREAAEAQDDADADLVGAVLLALVAGDLEACPAGLVVRTAAGEAVLAALHDDEGGSR